MSFTDWLRSRKQKEREAADKRSIPDGIWSKCAVCGHIVFQKDVLSNYHICPECDHYFPLNTNDRISLLLDADSFVAVDDNISALDPLSFDGKKPYRQSLDKAMKTTGLTEAIVTGFGSIEGRRVGFGVMEFGFIAGSMGSAVGEKVARLFEAAVTEKLPVVTVASSGGARMQEGMLSLMQMAKTAAAVERHNQAGLTYVSILANPTTGGVLASFASLGDIIIAEPKALVGFAGPRVVEQTLNEKLPKGFQSSESVLEHGMIDTIVPRNDLKAKTAQIIALLSAAEKRSVG